MWQPSPRLLPVSRRCRTVVTFHDLVFELFPEFYPWQSRLWQWQMSYPYLARMADQLIAVSENTKRDLVNIYHVNPDKITVIYEGVEPNYFQPVDPALVAALKAKFNIPEDYLYYVGSLEPRKNVVAIIRGLSYLKQQGFVNIKLVISGGKGWLNEAIFAEVEKLNLQGEVIFTGSVTEIEKIAWLQGARAFVFPTLYEGFGLPVLEAMAAGCPVITSQISSLPEVTGNAALLIDPRNQTELNLALNKILSDQDLIRQLKEQGQKRASQFTWGATAVQTLTAILHGGLPR
jgi:glycosyltransferase involved in cell wall biosynthesis